MSSDCFEDLVCGLFQSTGQTVHLRARLVLGDHDVDQRCLACNMTLVGELGGGFNAIPNNFLGCGFVNGLRAQASQRRDWGGRVGRGLVASRAAMCLCAQLVLHQASENRKQISCLLWPEQLSGRRVHECVSS